MHVYGAIIAGRCAAPAASAASIALVTGVRGTGGLSIGVTDAPAAFPFALFMAFPLIHPLSLHRKNVCPCDAQVLSIALFAPGGNSSVRHNPGARNIAIFLT